MLSSKYKLWLVFSVGCILSACANLSTSGVRLTDPAKQGATSADSQAVAAEPVAEPDLTALTGLTATSAPSDLRNAFNRLAESGDRSFIAILRHFLTDKRVVGDALMGGGDGPPMRVSEYAANAIHQLLGERPMFVGTELSFRLPSGPHPEWIDQWFEQDLQEWELLRSLDPPPRFSTPDDRATQASIVGTKSEDTHAVVAEPVAKPDLTAHTGLTATSDPKELWDAFAKFAKTHDRSLIATLRPFLADKRAIGNGSVGWYNGTPIRVSEIAANAINQLLGQEPMFAYTIWDSGTPSGSHADWTYKWFEWDVKEWELKRQLDSPTDNSAFSIRAIERSSPGTRTTASHPAGMDKPGRPDLTAITDPGAL